MMEFAYREFLSPRTMRTVLAALGATVAVFTVIGPVGTYETLSPLRRLGYWSLCYMIAWPVYFCMSAVALYYLRHSSPRTAALGLTGVALAASVPATGVVCSIDQLLRPAHLTQLPLLYARVTAVMVPVTFLVNFIVLERARNNGAQSGGTAEPEPGLSRHDGGGGAAIVDTPTAEAAPDSKQPAKPDGVVPTTARADAAPVPRTPAAAPVSPYSIFDRLPRRLGTDLVYLTVDDHYVEAHTRTGSAILLMRFSDACAELSDRGLQVHRSYWVAKRYMKRLVRRDGRTVLRLLTGEEIPVSRTYLAAARAVCRQVDLDAPAGPRPLPAPVQHLSPG
jgi:hypothetical protein